MIKTDFLTKILLLIFGMLLTLIIFYLTTHLLEVTGVYLAIIFTAILGISGTLLSKKQNIIKWISIGIIGTLSISVIAYYLIYTMLIKYIEL